MLRISIITAVFLLPFLTKAQYPSPQQKWGISFTPGVVNTPLLEYGFQPGVEYRISKKFYLLTDFAFIRPRTNVSRNAVDRKYFRIRPELKYMLPHGSRRFHEYLAVQFSYAFRKFRNAREGFYFSREIDSAVSFSSADIKSPISSAAVLYVFDFFPLKKFYVEIFGGMGVRSVATKYSNVQNPQLFSYQEPRKFVSGWPENAQDFNWTLHRFHVSVGMRLLYRFGNE